MSNLAPYKPKNKIGSHQAPRLPTTAQAPTPDPPPAVAESDDGAPTQRGAIPAAAFADLASRWAANALHVKFVDEADLDEIDAVLAETVPASAVPRTGPLFARGSAELEIERSVAEADTGVGQVDLWGEFRRGTEAARADLLASEFAYRNITITLVSEVARNYLLLRDLDERLAISQRTVQTRLESLKIIQARFDKGTVPQH